MPVLGRLKETGVSIRSMNSPRSGFRRAAATSWALAGIGVAGVAGASTLAYADTFKPPIATPAEVAIPAAEELNPPSALDLAPVPDAVTPTVDPPPDPAPVTTEAPQAPARVTAEAPVQRYTPEQTYEQAPAPVTHVAPAPAPAPTKVATAPTTTRHVNAPTTVKSPNYSPHVSVSRGS
jgi:protein TonB